GERFRREFSIRSIADDPDQERFAAERCDIGGGVRGGSAAGFGFLVPQNENRGFARHTSDRSLKKLIGNEVADDGDLLSRESFCVLFRRIHLAKKKLLEIGQKRKNAGDTRAV